MAPLTEKHNAVAEQLPRQDSEEELEKRSKIVIILDDKYKNEAPAPQKPSEPKTVEATNGDLDATSKPPVIWNKEKSHN